jgi:hypothetical protein
MEIREDAGFCTSDLPQIRHPERSALQMDRVTQRLVARSRRTSAVCILAMPLEPFQSQKPASGGPVKPFPFIPVSLRLVVARHPNARR